MPRISIVVTYYNSKVEYLHKCLDSILDQTVTDFEVIVICNEKVNSQVWKSVKEEYEKKDNRISFYSVDTPGASHARNIGISKCHGEHLCIIDADDFVEPVFLEKLSEDMPRFDLCICGIEEQDYPVIDMHLDKKVFFSLPDEFTRVQYINFSVNKIYKLKIIRDNGIAYPEDVALGEDAIFLSKYFEYCTLISCISDKLYHYVLNDASLTRTFDKAFSKYEEQVIDCQYSLFTQFPLCVDEQNALMRWIFDKLYYFSQYYLKEDKYYLEEANKIFELDVMSKLVQSNYRNNPRIEKWQKKVIDSWKKKCSV